MSITLIENWNVFISLFRRSIFVKSLSSRSNLLRCKMSSVCFSIELHYLRSFWRLFIFLILLVYGKTSNYVSNSCKDIISLDLSYDCFSFYSLIVVLYWLELMIEGRLDFASLRGVGFNRFKILFLVLWSLSWSDFTSGKIVALSFSRLLRITEGAFEWKEAY